MSYDVIEGNEMFFFFITSPLISENTIISSRSHSFRIVIKNTRKENDTHLHNCVENCHQNLFVLVSLIRGLLGVVYDGYEGQKAPTTTKIRSMYKSMLI